MDSLEVQAGSRSPERFSYKNASLGGSSRYQSEKGGQAAAGSGNVSAQLNKNNVSTLTHRPSTMVKRVFDGYDSINNNDSKEISEDVASDAKPLMEMEDQFMESAQ